ncbi:unnamed protein product [Lasius platythorax]|uniref:Uncharacterized protein n=1 Tax=Lasius platythorax TaxID=488582 RepID=A0AAV2NJF2_9HYME
MIKRHRASSCLIEEEFPLRLYKQHEERSKRMPTGERAIVPLARSSSKSSINLRPRSSRDPAAAVRAAQSVIDLRFYASRRRSPV